MMYRMRNFVWASVFVFGNIGKFTNLNTGHKWGILFQQKGSTLPKSCNLF